MQEGYFVGYNSGYFDVECALDTISALSFIRVCGSEDERRGMDILARRLDGIGVAWHYHGFRDRWLEPEDPHLIVRGRKIPVRPAMELSFEYTADFVSNEKLRVDVQARLSHTDDCVDSIAVAQHFSQESPLELNAEAQLLAYPFDEEMEPYLWAVQEWDAKRVPCAIVMPEDIPFILQALGEPAELKWSAGTVEREFRNLITEIPGREWPDEVIVMGAHIDSWPGTVGAWDDAVGSAVLVEAAKWFAKHPPSRTVRLIWFTGEEVDARGSRRYISECVDDPRAIKLMVNVDSVCEMNAGAFEAYASDESTIEWARQRLDLGGMAHSITKGGGTDARSFIASGIPAFFVEAPSKQSAHLPDDRPENVDPYKVQVLGTLSLGAAIHAACEWSI